MLPLLYTPAWLAASVILVAAVIYGSLGTGSSLPSPGEFDKLAHFGVYLVLAVWFTGLVARAHYWKVVVALVAALRRHDALDRVCLGAFSDDRLRRLRSLLGPGLCSAAGPREVAGLIRASKLGRAGAGSARSARDRDFDCVQVPVRHLRVEIVTADFVRTAHQQGVDVHVWTIDEADEMHRLLDLGVDGIMTDRPSVLRSVLVERGQWV
jgi:glycerophosphoryl diester phosphodiesterase